MGIFKKIGIMILGLMGIFFGSILFLGALGAALSDSEESAVAVVDITMPIETTEMPNKYLSEITWALDAHYACAVEIDDYNGDILEAGTYRFYPEAVVIGNGKIPVVWDVYISDKIYDDISQLHDDNPDFVGCVGGLDKCEITVYLEQGQYVYIKYYKVANNNPTGMLKITKTS